MLLKKDEGGLLIRIQKNDLLLFKYLFENQVLERNTIKKYIWFKKDNSTIDDRLAQLIKNGYINKISHPAKKRERLLIGSQFVLNFLKYEKERIKKIKQRGNSKLIYINPRRYRVIEEFDKRRIMHDLYLNKVRFKLEDLGVDNFKTSLIFESEKDFDIELYPDGYFEYNDKEYFLEFDLDYSYQRYTQALNKYRNAMFRNLIFIFKDYEILQNFSEKIKRNEEGIFFGLYDNIKKDKFILKNKKGDNLIIGSDEN